jgi:hypothetical protein
MSNVPSLAELISLKNPVITEHYVNNAIVYKLNGSTEDHERLINAAENASTLLFAGIEAVTDLLYVTEVNCSNQLFTDTKTSALWLLKELTQTLQAVHHQEWILNQVEQDQVEVLSNSKSTDTKKPI